MFVQSKILRYWKTEHDEQKCEDAYAFNAEQGVFAVADGVGTAAFSAIWAHVLVHYFVAQPLMSSDPFEVEWWLRQAHTRYDQETPALSALPEIVRDKAREGSLSTLATLRITSIKAGIANAMMLVFGDSCVMVGDEQSQTVTSFVLDTPSAFNVAPICVPSRLAVFDRNFHQCKTRSLQLRPGQMVLLATDAVAKWVLSCGTGTQGTLWDAFMTIVNQTETTWPTFIQACRDQEAMVDDDCTALVLFLTATNQVTSVPLGTMAELAPEIVADRHHQLNEARATQDTERIAILIGDQQMVGQDFPAAHLAHVRNVADALRTIRSVFNHALSRNLNVALKMEPVWQKYRHLLQDDPSAKALAIRNNLATYGLDVTPVAPAEAVTPQDALTPLGDSDEQLLQSLIDEGQNPETVDQFRTALESDQDQ